MELLTTLGIPVLAIIKIAIVIFLSLYTLFSVVLVRQVKLMIETLEIGFETAIKYTSYIHLLVAIVVLILSAIFL